MSTEYKTFQLKFKGRHYPLKSVFKGAELSGLIFDHWYHRVESELPVDGLADTTFEALMSFLNGEDRRVKVSAKDAVKVCVEWDAGGFVEWCGFDETTTTVMAGLRESGRLTPTFEASLAQKMARGDFGDVSNCPVEVVMRASAGLNSGCRVRLAKLMGEFGGLFLEGVLIDELSDDDVVGLENVAGGSDLLTLYRTVKENKQMAESVRLANEEKETLQNQRATESKAQQLRMQQIKQDCEAKMATQRLELENANKQIENEKSRMQQIVEIERSKSEAEKRQHQKELKQMRQQHAYLQKQIASLRPPTNQSPVASMPPPFLLPKPQNLSPSTPETEIRLRIQLPDFFVHDIYISRSATGIDLIKAIEEKWPPQPGLSYKIFYQGNEIPPVAYLRSFKDLIVVRRYDRQLRCIVKHSIDHL